MLNFTSAERIVVPLPYFTPGRSLSVHTVKSAFGEIDCANWGSYELVAAFHRVNVSKIAAPSMLPVLPDPSPLPKAGSRLTGCA